MNRRKMLFRYEMKSMSVFLILGLLGVFGAAFYLNARLASLFPKMHGINIYSYSSSGLFEQGCVFAAMLTIVLKGIVSACFFGFAVMSFTQFSDLQSRKKREYLNSLPFTQSEKFRMKVIVSYGMITLCWLLLSVSVIGLRLRYQTEIIKNNVLSRSFKQFMGADTMWHTIRSLLLCWLTLLAMYSIYMAINYLVRNSLLATLVGVAAMYYPVFVVNMVFGSLLSSGYYAAPSYEKVASVVDRAERYTRMFFGSGLGYVYDGSGFSTEYVPLGKDKIQSASGFCAVSYGKVWFFFLVLIVLVIACTMLAWWVNEHQDLAKINHPVPTKFGRIGLGLGLSTSIGGVVAMLVSPAQLTVSLGIWLVSSIILYCICRKILKL